MKALPLIVSLILSQVGGFCADPISVKLNANVSRWCHMVRFQQGWSFDDKADPSLDVGDYEFRRLAMADTEFVVAGFTTIVTATVPHGRTYTANKYIVDLSIPGQAPRPATEEQWRGAKEVALYRQSTFKGTELHWEEPASVELNGHRLTKTGKHWAPVENQADRLSADGSLLVLNSWSGNGDTGMDFEIKFAHGKLFWDICNTTSGEKLVTIEGGFRGATDPGTLLGNGAWLTDRYYIIPMGGAWERCLVCDFGEAGTRTF